MAITERYVSRTGTDTYANSTSPSTPCSLATAITNAAAGDRFNILDDGTDWTPGSSTFANNGSATSPIVWRGYASTIGDATIGRSSGGALNTTNMPKWAFTSTSVMNVTGTFNIFEAIDISGTRSGALVTLNGNDSCLVGCRVVNNSTNAAAIAVDGAGSRTMAIDCDIASGASGGTCAARFNQTAAVIEGCRVTSPGAIGIITGATALVALNTVYGCGGDGIAMNSATGTPDILQNTVYGCTGDAIDIISTATLKQHAAGNHLTDNGGFGINMNGATAALVQYANRFRDNAGGEVSGAADWASAVCARKVTTDTGGASTDYTNAGSGDFSLIAAAPGISGSFSYLMDIGAQGTPVVAGSGGPVGASMRGGFVNG